MNTQHAYSFRGNGRVPDFDDQSPLIVFDKVCVLCNGFVQFVLRHDSEGRIMFTSAQGKLGQALYVHYGMPTDEFETNLVIIDGVLHEKLDAFVAVMIRLGWPWKTCAVLWALPRPVADWFYDRVARNRYALFGKHETCPVPTPEMRRRLVS